MKVIKYKKLLNPNMEDEEQRFMEIEMGYNEANEEIAKREAYNGEYTIEDDGQPETDAAPTLEDRVGTLESDSAETKEALELLLSGVTE